MRLLKRSKWYAKDNVACAEHGQITRINCSFLRLSEGFPSLPSTCLVIAKRMIDMDLFWRRKVNIDADFDSDLRCQDIYATNGSRGRPVLRLRRLNFEPLKEVPSHSDTSSHCQPHMSLLSRFGPAQIFRIFHRVCNLPLVLESTRGLRLGIGVFADRIHRSLTYADIQGEHWFGHQHCHICG